MSILVMIVEKATAAARGELTRWLIEPRCGVFVGDVSARVRDALWNKCALDQRIAGVVQIWSSNCEQRLRMRIAGDTSRILVEEEGLQLVKIPCEVKKARRIREKEARERKDSENRNPANTQIYDG